MQLPKVIVTSVVRGSQQGESHGGVYIVDFETGAVDQRVDWNSGDIDFAGRGADRGLRGISLDGDDIYIAASDELFCYSRDFKIKNSWRNPYLKHCHEIVRMGRKLFLTSTGFDSLLAFDLDVQTFDWGFHLLRQRQQWGGFAFDPGGARGPRPVNRHHLNMVHVDTTGIYMSGLKTNALLHTDHRNKVQIFCNLPPGTHNAHPFLGGTVFNDTENNQIRYVPRNGRERTFPIRQYNPEDIQFAGIDDSRIARQGFGRGLCTVSESLIVGGSSPSTVSLYDLKTGETIASINLTMDIRNAVHGLEIWPGAW